MEEFLQKNRRVYHFLLRWGIFMIGLWIFSLGLALTIKAELGVAPWDVLHIGLWLNFGWTIGTWSIIVSFLIVGIASLISRSWPKAGTVLNMIFIGIFIDLALMIPWLQTPETFLGKFAMLLAGIVINGYGIGLYIAPRCGAGPRDSLMLALTERTGWKVQWTRITIEATVLVIGWLLGGPVFIGTICFVLGTGTMVGFTLPQCQKVVDRLLGGIEIEDLNKGKIRLNHHDGISQ